jgi:hypothetical protein
MAKKMFGPNPMPGRKDGGKRTSTYGSWSNMIQRCSNPKATGFKNYGGRGIAVCERWRDFDLFLADMGSKPSPKHSIDRWPNAAGNYEPGNCRWATRAEQNATQRHPGGMTHWKSALTEAQVREARVLVRGGMLHRDVAARMGVGRSAISQIINGANWSHIK